MKMLQDKNLQSSVILSAHTEWRAIKSLLVPTEVFTTPYGEAFFDKNRLFMHGGWGKIDAAASCQYLISRWNPPKIVNLGTCGGISGRIDTGTIMLVDETIVYDIYEKMGDADSAVDWYKTSLDLDGLSKSLPAGIQRGHMLSADRDLDPEDIPQLIQKYKANAVDWESGSIARVCNKNQVPLLILRGVSDIVSDQQPQCYSENQKNFKNNTAGLIKKMIEALPFLLEPL